LFIFGEVILKRIISILITFAVVFLITGCAQNNNNAVSRNSNGKINVIATIFPPYDFVRQIAGDRVNLTMLLSPGAESHSFEPSPRDIIRIQNSDIFIYAGGESDNWVDHILQSMNTDKMEILSMMNTVKVVKEEVVEGMQGDQDTTPGSPTYDEHVWTSPRNAILIVRAITELLCKADSADAAFFRQNSDAYIAKLQDLDATFSRIVSDAKRKTLVFGDRFPFRYFVEAYGLSYYAAFPGCSTETEPSAATVAFLIDKIRQEHIPVVFYIELSNERMADTISAETGAKKLLFHACHNITKDDFDAGLGYLDFMRRNAENLRTALN